VSEINKSPLERYRSDLEREDFSYDAAQEQAVLELQDLYDRLVVDNAKERPQSALKRLVGGGRKKKEPQQGLYFWGGVGRGKTYLMDNFFESLPFERKMRVHFHRFMLCVHRELTELDGESDPLEIVADHIASEARILCFDEFFVSDIADAMILGTLLQMLFDRGVSLVATSNIIPDNLYQNGLQRQRFLPAIDMLNRFTKVVNVDSGVDYRLRVLTRAEIYHSPLDAGAEVALSSAFNELVPAKDEIREAEAIEIERRMINTRFLAEDIVWFDFLDICDGPRSQNDYIEISREFHEVLISNVPVLGKGRDDQARRFINMVDEFYDRGVKLILSAAVPLDDLYGGGTLEFEFQRTASRLLEMRSHEYLARPHKP